MKINIRRIDFWPDAWIAGTQGMTLEEEGAYCRLTMRYYSLGEALPADPIELAHLCNVRPQIMRRLLVKLAPKFDETEGKLRSNRCETELKLARNRVETARNNGSKPKHNNGLEEPAATHIDKSSSEPYGLKAKRVSELGRARAREGAGGASLASPAPRQQEAEAAAEAEYEAERQQGLADALADLAEWKAKYAPEHLGEKTKTVGEA